MNSEIITAYINREMIKKEHQYATTEVVKVFVGSFNCAGSKPSGDVTLWLRGRADLWIEQEEKDITPDILLIGLQEMCDLKATNILGDEKSAHRWVDFLLENVIRAYGDDYKMVATNNLVGLVTVIFARTDLVPSQSQVYTMEIKTGFKGIAGNKGAVVFSLPVWDSRICVINAHFAAHKGNVKQRNEDFANISASIKFKNGSTLKDHDNVFWFGDLNYRIDNPLTFAEIVTNAETSQFQRLREHDQLLQEKQSKKVFQGYHEQKINFPPTYKYKKGADQYANPPGNAKKREPAWCDRILTRGEVTGLCYNACNVIKLSDHKPIFAFFEMPVKKKDWTKHDAVYKKIREKVEAQSSTDEAPQIEISKEDQHLFFDPLYYKTPAKHNITITNVGQYLAEFYFDRQQELDNVGKRWLQVEPVQSLILAGRSVTVQVTLYIDENTARRAFKTPDYLSALLTLQIKRGNSYFIEIEANYLQSCFGATLTALAKCPHPPSLYALREPLIVFATETTVEIAIPRQIWRILDFIEQKGLKDPSLFQKTGDQAIMAKIRTCLDNNDDFSHDIDLASMCDILLEFLSTLCEPMVPTDLLDEFCMAYLKSGATDCTLCQKFIEALPACNQRCFVYMISYLNHLLAYRQNNKLTPEKLIVFLTDALTQSNIIFERMQRKTVNEQEREALVEKTPIKRFHR